MKIDKEHEIEKREEASDLEPGTSCTGEIERDVSYTPHKEAIIVDIEKVIGPRKSYIPLKKPSLNHFDRRIFDTEDEITPPHWAVPWSDIMMVVFVMFAVLFIYSLSKRDIADA
ncbi:MAG: hypothetical protein ACXWL9_11365, partial [Syntrophales bacterium]